MFSALKKIVVLVEVISHKTVLTLFTWAFQVLVSGLLKSSVL